MDTKKIGGFLKSLRTARGLTQEQLAEILSVSGRTVSRWETGTNMPELSILIQIAEFYEVEVKEILDGERRCEGMDKEVKDTLTKVADYSKLEKEKASKAGQAAFGTIFSLCVVMIVVQLLAAGDLLLVAGETVVLLFGGIVYISLMVHNGIWDFGLTNTPFSDALISVICSGIFTVVLSVCYTRLGAESTKTTQVALVFFIAITVIGFAVLRLLSFFNKKSRDKVLLEDGTLKVEELQVQPVKVFVADGNLQAQMVIEALKRNHIAAYGQDMGDAGFAAARYGMGRGMDDRVVIMVSDLQVDEAKKVLAEMGFQ